MSDNHESKRGLRVIDAARLRTLGLETGLGLGGVAALFAEQMAFQLEDLHAAIHAGSDKALSAVAHRCLGSTTLAGMEQLSALLRALEANPGQGLRDAEGCLASVERMFADVLNELAVLAEGTDIADVA